MKKALIAGMFALASIVAFAQPAAAETGDRQMEIVRTADLDLTHEAGAAALEGRIRAAARRICNRPDHPGELRYWSAYRTCMRETLQKTLTRVDSPLVLARFDDIPHAGSFVTASR